VLVSLAYALFRAVLDLLLIRTRRAHACELELLMLRHEVRVLRRQTKRPGWRPGDRLVFAATSRRFPRHE